MNSNSIIHIIFLVLCLSLNIICKILPVVLDNNLFIFTAVYHSLVWVGHNTFILALWMDIWVVSSLCYYEGRAKGYHGPSLLVRYVCMSAG